MSQVSDRRIQTIWQWEVRINSHDGHISIILELKRGSLSSMPYSWYVSSATNLEDKHLQESLSEALPGLRYICHCSLPSLPSPFLCHVIDPLEITEHQDGRASKRTAVWANWPVLVLAERPRNLFALFERKL